jgi:hypothetical protein
MSAFLQRLARRAVGETALAVRPRLPARFEGGRTELPAGGLDDPRDETGGDAVGAPLVAISGRSPSAAAAEPGVPHAPGASIGSGGTARRGTVGRRTSVGRGDSTTPRGPGDEGTPARWSRRPPHGDAGATIDTTGAPGATATGTASTGRRGAGTPPEPAAPHPAVVHVAAGAPAGSEGARRPEAPSDPESPPAQAAPLRPRRDPGSERDRSTSSAGPERRDAGRRDAPEPGADSLPAIRVTIGRVEVRAVSPPPRPAPRPLPEPRLRLDDYLRERREGRR